MHDTTQPIPISAKPRAKNHLIQYFPPARLRSEFICLLDTVCERHAYFTPDKPQLLDRFGWHLHTLTQKEKKTTLPCRNVRPWRTISRGWAAFNYANWPVMGVDGGVSDGVKFMKPTGLPGMLCGIEILTLRVLYQSQVVDCFLISRYLRCRSWSGRCCSARWCW